MTPRARFALLAAVFLAQAACTSGTTDEAGARNGRPQPLLSIAGAAVPEGDAGATPLAFRLTLDPASSETVRVRYRLDAGTAMPGADFVDAQGEIVFAPGTTEQALTVAVNGDTEVEPDEAFTVRLMGAVQAQLANDTAEGRILNDDSNRLRVGAAKRAVAPSPTHIAGALEQRAYADADGNVGEQRQQFGLGGYGLSQPESLANPTYAHIGNGFATGNYRGMEEDGQEHSTYVRAFVIEQKGGDVVAFVTLDAVGAGNIVQKHLKAAVTAATGIPADNVLFGQTHSHSAADLQGLWGGVPATWLDCDDSPEQQALDGCGEDDWSRGLYQLAAEAVKQAWDERVPAELVVATGTLDRNRRRTLQVTPDQSTDKAMTVLQARAESDGRVVGTILQYAAHPTILGDDNRLVHGDFVLSGLVRLERAGGTALYYNGPIADAAPAHEGRDCLPGEGRYCNARTYGRDLADFALQLLAERATVVEPSLAVRHANDVMLPVTNAAFLAAGMARMFNRYYNFVETPVDDVPAVALLRNELPQVAPFATTTVSRVTLGAPADGRGLEIATIPGEGRNALGQLIRYLAYGEDRDAKPMMLLGLTHNSFGYIIPEEEYGGAFHQGELYEEVVSLGPLTAPLLRLQAYFPLFDAPAEAYAPQYLTTCQATPDSDACMLEILRYRAGADGDSPLGALVDAIDDLLDTLAEGCREYSPVPEACAVTDTLAGLLDGDLPPEGGNTDVALVGAAVDAVARGCDLLDPSHCLLPFPSDHFTVAAPADSPQGVNNGGTGRRVNFPAAAMPRNVAGKPIDPTEWNRNDGFSPGQMIVTYVPGLAAGADGTIPGLPTIRDSSASLDLAGSPVLVLDAETGEPHPVWAEIDLNAGMLLYVPGREAGAADSVVANPKPKQAALIIRPARNFEEGHRYVVVLRNLPRAGGGTIAAGAAFRACRDGVDSALPPVQARCEALAQRVFPVLDGAGVAVAGNAGLYLAWDFTVASAANTIGRLRHMRDDAFRNYLGQQETAAGEITNLGRAPAFEVTEVNDYPASHGQLVREVKGTFTVPSYVVPTDPSPADGQAELRRRINGLPPEIQSQLEGGPLFAPIEASLPPNRLNYLPDASSDAACDPDDAEAALQGRCAEQARFGDGLPDSTGEMSTTFTCRIARSTLNNKSFAEATAADVTPARPSLYGHGLLGDHGEINQDQLRNFGNDHNVMFCATDWFGFASGDLPNVVSFTLDLSNFASLPDGTQQGVLNQLFLARLLRHPQGFASHGAFRVGDTPVFDTREVYYDGNSQGGITGGVVIAASKDIRRGALGVPGMNYSTLLTRSVDFDIFSVPLYLSYPDDLDRSVNFSLMQMLWDRSENNGYAHHLRDNRALGGPDKHVLLHPAFGDHQVTMWSADAMARTVGATVDRSRIAAARREPVGFNAPELPGFAATDYGNPQHAAGSGLMYWDEAWPDTSWQDCAGSSTPPPPVGNVPPRQGSDPHECPRRQAAARCQKSHFMHSPGRFIDVSGVDGPADCPALPAAEPLPLLPVAGDPAIPPFPFNPCVPDALPGLGGECLLDVPVLGDALEETWAWLNGGDPPDAELPGNDDVEPVVAELAENAATLPEDLEASAQQLADNAAAGALADRSAEAVVMEGRQFPDWSQPAAQGVAMPYPNGAFIGERSAHAGVMLYPPAGFTGLPTAAPVNEIVAYRRDNGAWVEIPVQVDERFPYFLANPNSDFGIYSGTDLELTYAWDRETWKASGECSVDPASVTPTPDPVPGLDDDDEIAFMARDAGDFADPAIAGPDGTVGGGQQVALTDPLAPGAPRYVYLFRKPSGPTFSVWYVDYARDADADQFIDRSFFEGGPETDPYKRNALGTSNTGYGPNLSGTVCWDGTPLTARASSDRFPRDGVTVSTDKYQVYASGRWMVRDVRIAKPGQPRAYGADLVDRWKGRAFQQSPDSTISLVGFEDEQVNWEANSALLGERLGPVRAIREVWGADSGTNVTKTETYYSDAYSFRYRVRVHPIPPDGLYTSWDYNRGAMVPAPGEAVPGGRYYTAVRGTGVPIDGQNDDVGNVDGLGETPAYFDMADPTLNLPLAMYNWEQVSGKGDLGSLVYLFELKSPTIGANAAAVPYYRDDACLDDGTGDDPVARPWPGEASTDARVRNAYSALAGGTPYEQLACDQKQGAHAQHGVHFFAPPESDNAFQPVPVDEIDGQQWAFAVPTSEPTNVGERYASVLRTPLARAVTPRPAAP